MTPEGYCIECGLDVESFKGLECCPHCGTKSPPANYADVVDVKISWYELRILTIWAERWAHTFKGAGTVYAIARRLQKQHPEKTIPLTLAGEVEEIKQIYGRDKVETNIPGTE